MYRLKLKPYRVYWVAAFFSLLLSAWIGYRETVINPDAICYLQSAAAMKEGIHAAMNVCSQAKWPFYSLLIAVIVNLTKLSYVTAAYTLDSVFSLVTVLSFIGIIAFIAKTHLFKQRLLWLAALVILLAHEFNAVKTYIIRDHGFWAFYVVSILFLLYYFHTRRAYYAFLWSASVIVAALFRIEGAIFLLAVPFISWLEVKQTWATRLKTFLQLNAGVFIVSFIAAGYFLFYPTHSVSGRLPELQFQLLHGLTLLKQNFQLKEAGLAAIVLGTNGARDAAAVLTLTLLTWYVLNVIVNLSLIYTGLFIYSGWNRLLTATQTTRLVLWGYIITNVVVTALFLAQNMFLSKRYLIALSLVLMLWVPFALAHLMQQWDRRKWPFVLVMLFIIFSSLGGIFDFGYSKQYVRDAGEWLALHVPSKALVYSNDLQLMYYSKHFGSQQLFIQAEAFSHPEALAQSAWKKYDYLAVRVDQKQLSSAAGILHEIQKTEVPIQVFRNKRGDQVRIYRRKP